MKLRNSFVSNSSSASFILEMFTNNESLTEDDVIRIIEDKLGDIINGINSNDKDVMKKNIEKIDNQKFVINFWTVMYNGPENIPEFMKDFYILHQLHGEEESDFWRVDLRVEED